MELFAQFDGRDDVLLIPHIGGRYADIVGFHDPRLERVVEIYSDWERFEWLLEDALRSGYRVGFVANSDGHKGRPGASHPGAFTFGAYGGVTCVLAESLTREAVFEAICQRRCYGVTAAQRIHVELAVNGLPTGAEARAEGPVTLRGRVVGTGALERVDVFRGPRDRQDRVALSRDGLRGGAALSRRVGRLAGARARPPDALGRLRTLYEPTKDSSRIAGPRMPNGTRVSQTHIPTSGRFSTRRITLPT